MQVEGSRPAGSPTRLDRLSNAPRLTVVIAGGVAGLGQAPVSLPWITLAMLVVAAWLFTCASSIRQAAWRGWLFGLGYFSVTLHWIFEPFLVDAARHAWMAPFALFGLAAGIALFWGAAAAAARAVGPSPLAWALALGGAELLRSYVLTGFPWALIGHVWIGWPPMQLAAWVGPHGLTALTLLFAAMVVLTWRSWQALAVVVGTFALFFIASPFTTPSVPAATGPIVRLIQPNAPQHLKWHPDHIQTFFQRQVGFTAAPAERRPDLIVWPETAVPALLHHAGPALDRVTDAAAGVPVVVGIQRRDERGIFNSLAYLDSAGTVAQVYDKHHLVPFGEYIPAFGLLSALPFGAFVEEHGFGYTPGPGATLLDFGSLGKVLPLICYEAVFPQDVNSAPARPDWLLQITNDAWFGAWVGPYQHLAQARLRAVEQGLPMIRVANTGVSAVIDPRGRITAELPLNTAGFLDAELPPASKRTTYARVGDWPLSFFYLAGLLALGIALRRNPH